MIKPSVIKKAVIDNANWRRKTRETEVTEKTRLQQALSLDSFMKFLSDLETTFDVPLITRMNVTDFLLNKKIQDVIDLIENLTKGENNMTNLQQAVFELVEVYSPLFKEEEGEGIELSLETPINDLFEGEQTQFKRLLRALEKKYLIRIDEEEPDAFENLGELVIYVKEAIDYDNKKDKKELGQPSVKHSYVILSKDRGMFVSKQYDEMFNLSLEKAIICETLQEAAKVMETIGSFINYKDHNDYDDYDYQADLEIRKVEIKVETTYTLL